MKRSFITLFSAAALLITAAGCTSNDSVKEAEKVNDAKAETTTADTDMGKVEKTGMDYDSEFMAKAASGGMLEVEMGKQVAARAVTPDAKKFAEQMVSDHSKANAELMALAAKKNITLPTTLSDDHSKVLKDVVEEKGVKMDQEYMKEMLKDHEEDVKEFTDASIKASDPDIKAFAAKNVPVLQMHLDMVTKMKPTVDAAK
ncbi:putative membrane protein [Hymenobacter sp. UYAg731]